MVFRVTFFILLLPFFIYSQTNINGRISDGNNTALQGASVIVTKIKENIILAYAISDENGVYSLRIDSKLDSLQIKTSFISYAQQVKTVRNKAQKLDFTLLESSEKLKEVIVKNIPITKKGDTINYAVSVFKDQGDRVIADVLDKIPGIEVLTDGKILYQGKPIQKYYIEGLDLLEGKYNLANNNLPANSVSKIQILENHQPIKLLDSLVFSDKTSLNIKLKKNITVTGTSKIGVGLSPVLWDVNATPMLFAKKKQMISSYQTNNVGNDISNEIKTLTINDLSDELESNNEKEDWVTIQKLSSPSFSEKRWLDNNAHLFTTNYLTRSKNDLDLKVNLSYVNDFQQQKGNTQTTFFTTTDTTSIIEHTNNKLFFNSLKTKFVLARNTSKNYFKNTFEVNKYWDSENGKIILNDDYISQKAKTPFISFNNKLKLLKSFGKKIVTIKSDINYSKSSQNLHVLPGFFESLLNNDNSFDELNQKIEHFNFYTNNSFSFTRAIKKITFISKTGFTIQNQQLDSGISIFKNNSENILTNEFQNNLLFNTNSLYTILKTQYQNNDWKVELELPLTLKLFKRTDKSLSTNESFNPFILEPTLFIKRDLNAFWKTTFSASLKNNFGDIKQLYYGYVLNNYRNIQKYETPILQGLRKKSTLGLSYRNPIKSLFINGFYSYVRSNQNLLLGNNIDDNGTTSFGFFDQENKSSTHTINLKGSTYFSTLKTILSLTTNAVLDNKNQLLNGIITDIKTRNIQFKGKLDTEITEWMGIEYKSDFSISKTQFKNFESFDNIITQEHLLDFNFYPFSNQYINFEAEYFKNNISKKNKENYFLNLNYIYTFKESRIDLELNWNNILNTKEFTTVINDTFSYTQSTYLLRQRQLLISMKFNL